MQFVVAQSPEKLDVLAKLNEARRNNGLPPLAWSPLLDKAAQRHSEDMADKGFVDETGSDGSSPRQRIEATGYAAWSRQRVWAESLYAGQGTFDEALAFFLSDDGQRRVVLSPKLREVGIGIAKDALRTYWTLTFGAQPNLLPIFINDDAPVTNERQVAVILTQEEAVPDGDANAIGRVIEVRLSDQPDFAGAQWQPWERLIPFTLSPRRGRQTIYVEMRDDAGRTTIASDSIEYDPNARDAIRPVAPGEAIASPEPAEATPPAPTPAIVTATPATADPNSAVAVVVTLAPEATGTAPPAATVPPPQPTPAAVVVVIQPTSTSTPPPDAIAGTPITIVLTPTPDGAVRQFGAFEVNALPMEWIVPAYLIAQAGVIGLGLYALLRRR
ncbi:MAG: CAP domain-containing protein [Anaerolineae bacterium]|nr:CAP domain-containing protein [Candidatus Roseilinea sp.]MDW8449487.1 CAP domain-containing protein [Anaerolineae bacterium]